MDLTLRAVIFRQIALSLPKWEGHGVDFYSVREANSFSPPVPLMGLGDAYPQSARRVNVASGRRERGQIKQEMEVGCRILFRLGAFIYKE